MKNPAPPQNGIFLELELHYEAPDDCHINLVYLESPKKRTTILTERYLSKAAVLDALEKDSAVLFKRARALCPAIGIREAHNLARVKDLPFETLDVECDYCGSRPGEPCGDSNECRGDREEGLHRFLIWLAEQDSLSAKKLTKTRVRAVLNALGIKVHGPNRWANPYGSDMGLAIQQPQTDHFWCLFVGGRLDNTGSAWLTCGMNFSRPERGPFRDEREIALALRAWGRGE